MTDISVDAQDEMAQTVIERYRRAKDYRRNTIIHQGASVETLLERARSQYDREYTCQDAAMMEQAFGFVPSRYYGVAQQKVNATYYWKLDLVVTSLDSMFIVNPTPYPDIDDETKQTIRQGIRDELINRMLEVGVVDPNMFLLPDGSLNPRIQDWLTMQAQALKSVEQARIVSAASKTAREVQIHMRDVLVEGGFRQAYSKYSFDQILYGRGVMRFPYRKMMPVRYHTRGGGVAHRWEARPTFSHVDTFQFYPVDDSDSLQTNTGNTQLASITKAELINMARNSKTTGYYASVIEDILTEYEYQPRNWLGPDNPDGDQHWWGLDETIPILIHEGYFSGQELADMGITGVDKLDYRSARVEVVGGRTIRCELIESQKGTGRTYYQAPFNITGPGIYDSIGLAAMVWDTEQRINRLLHMFENNVDWASRPPLLRNASAFDNPTDASHIFPGGQFDVEQTFGVTGSMPDAVRPMNAVSAQYHLIMTQVNALLQLADNDAGIPAFAYGTASNYGRSSLGEYTQRVSGSLRTVKGLAMHEDFYFIEPCFTELYDTLLEENPDLRKGADINVTVRGMTGLLKEDMRAARQEEMIPLLMQGVGTGMVSPQAAQYGVRQLLESAGFPVDELGMSDPVIDNALAVAAGMPISGAPPAGQQVPQLDGRSGPIPSGNVASPEGLNQANLAQVGPF